MALSVFLRNASTKLSGCPNKLLSQQLIRSNTTLINASALRTLTPSQNLLNKYQKQQIVPKTNYASVVTPPKENKVSLWIAERVVASSLIVTLPLAIAIPSKILDIVVAVTMTAHIYWGLEAMVQEYVRPLLFGTLMPKIAHVFVILLMMLSLGGLFYLIFDDIGIAGTVRRLWSIKSNSQ